LNAYDPLREEIHRALMRLYAALATVPPPWRNTNPARRS